MKTKNTKAVFSIRDICAALELSRARFYQLLNAGILPLPLYDLHTKRPFYNFELQEQCRQVKETCIGINGQYILFYTPRRRPQSNSGKSLKKADPVYQEIIEMLSGMGLVVSDKDVELAIKEVYPQGMQEQDQGLVVRELFRFLKRKNI
jgi:hypothetical protein